MLKKDELEFVSVEFGVCLFSHSGSSSGNVWWCPCLALEACLRLQAAHSLWMSPSGLAASRLVLATLPCWLFIITRPRGGSSNVQQHHRYHLHLPLEGASCAIGRVGYLDLPCEVLFSLQGKSWVCSPALVPHVLMWARLFPIMCSFWWNSCPFHVRGQSV